MEAKLTTLFPFEIKQKLHEDRFCKLYCWNNVMNCCSQYCETGSVAHLHWIWPNADLSQISHQTSPQYNVDKFYTHKQNIPTQTMCYKTVHSYTVLIIFSLGFEVIF